MGDAERKPVPGGLSTGLGRAAVADPAANTWGAHIVAAAGTRAEGVDALVWFSDANALISTMSVEIPLWNVDASNEDDTDRARRLASMGQRIVAGGGAGEETFKFTIPAVQHLMKQDADIRWMGSLDDLIGDEDPAAIGIRTEFRKGDGSAPIADGDRDAFITFLRERAA